jgi:capsular polysaccharide transport system permease protein
LKKDLANPNKKALNAYIFEFERLKNLVEFNKELYKQSLLQLEQLKVQANQNSKMLLEVTKPFVPQGYMYPQKLKDMITLTLVLLLLYGIISLIQAIIKEHID